MATKDKTWSFSDACEISLNRIGFTLATQKCGYYQYSTMSCLKLDNRDWDDGENWLLLQEYRLRGGYEHSHV